MRYGASQFAGRREDRRLVTGSGRYVADLALPHMAHAVMVYSDRAHGRIESIDVARALAAPGVIAVLTGADAKADGLGGVGPRFLPQMFGYGYAESIPRPCLVADKVRHVGDRVAMVVAETQSLAEDAALLVDVKIAPLRHAVTIADALAESAEAVHSERPDNIAYELRMGDADETEQAFRGAHSVHRVEIDHPRVTANSMETRGAVGVYSEVDRFYTLYTSTQAPHSLRAEIAAHCLKIPESSLRVVSHDVGGGFGMKTSTYPEDALVLWAAQITGRPVKWIGSRSDAHRTDEQGRGSRGYIELALDKDARIVGIRTRIDHDVGAYMVCAGPMPPIHTARLIPGVYRVPALDAHARAVYTNNPTTVPYRGAGRPEGIFAVEQALDQAARDLSLSPIEIRRRNYLKPTELPHKTKANFVYDSGEFEAIMDRCLEFADWNGFDARRKADAERGLLRGRGLGMYIHDTGAANDQAEIRFDPGGTVTLISGTHDTGQGHATTFSQQVAERLGIDAENIRVVQGDTDRVAFGRGSFASRSVTMVGSAIELACTAIIDKGKCFAAQLLDASADEIEFDAGNYKVVGTNRAISISDVAKASFQPRMAVGESVGLAAGGAFAMKSPSFPNGCHVCELTVDPDTGALRIDRYAVVDDLGRILNPVLCEGQIHGAIAQGFGESVTEVMVSDRESGQLLSGSFLDYAMPRAGDLPFIKSEFRPTLCTTNPAGAKGAGEGGTVGSLSAIRAAALDALSPLGVTDVPKPLSPAAVWGAIQAANRKNGGPDSIGRQRGTRRRGEGGEPAE